MTEEQKKQLCEEWEQAFHKTFIKASPDLITILNPSTALLLGYFFYWFQRIPDGVVFKTDTDIMIETGLTPKTIKNAKAKLIREGLLIANYSRRNHVTYYTLNPTRMRIYIAYRNGEIRKQSNTVTENQCNDDVTALHKIL